MRVIITGVTGFVGSHLAEYLLDKAEVWGLKRWRSPTQNIDHLKLNLIDGDLKDLSFCIQMINKIKPDKIFHLAAQSYVPFSYTNPIETIQDNVIGTANLLEAVRLTEQDPLIHICSSSEVYGQVREEDLPINELCRLNPASPYGVSKVAEDMLGLMYYTAYGLKTVRTRMFTHTGPRRGEVFVCSKFAKQIAEREKYGGNVIYSVGYLDSVRTFADVRDTVRAYWLLRDDMAGQVYNIGGDTTMTCREMLIDLLTLSKLEEWDIDDKPTDRPAEVTLQIPDTTKFKEATGWKPEIPFSQTLSDLLDYWRGRV